MPAFLPASGKSGDMSEVKGAAGQAPQWAPTEGLLEFAHMPGHAPGQIVMLHKPTASLLAADTITNLRGGFLHKSAPQPGFAPPGSIPLFRTSLNFNISAVSSPPTRGLTLRVLVCPLKAAQHALRSS